MGRTSSVGLAPGRERLDAWRVLLLLLALATEDTSHTVEINASRARLRHPCAVTKLIFAAIQSAG
jgi:hypothetical protein